MNTKVELNERDIAVLANELKHISHAIHDVRAEAVELRASVNSLRVNQVRLLGLLAFMAAGGSAGFGALQWFGG